MERDFPEDFVWGAATCPACAEGETVSDWAKLAAPDGSVPDDGPRHWRRYRYDFRTMADLGLKAYRFGLDWARLQRAPYGELSRGDGYRYMEMLAELRGLGIEPWVVLFQHALPRWAAAAGGWLNPETPYWFADFARRLARLTDGEVRHWVTIHEPQVYALSSYAWGVYPGGVWGRLDQARLALARLRAGHRLAVAAIRKHLKEARVGLALAGGGFRPRRVWHPGDWLAAQTSEWLLNRVGVGKFLKGDGRCDFLMLGTGNEVTVSAWESLSMESGVSRELAARMRRQGGTGVSAGARRRRLAEWLRRHRLPVYVVGANGGQCDEARLMELLAAYAGGGAAGFFYEPLVDQFDMDTGLTSGRGLLRVDFHDGDRRREVRRFAQRLARVARSGRLQDRAGAHDVS